MRGRTDDKTLQAIAEHEKERCQQEHRDVRIETEQLKSEERGKQCRAQQGAMREIDDVQYAIDQRQP